MAGQQHARERIYPEEEFRSRSSGKSRTMGASGSTTKTFDACLKGAGLNNSDGCRPPQPTSLNLCNHFRTLPGTPRTMVKFWRLLRWMFMALLGLGDASLRLLACPLHRRWVASPLKLLQITISTFPRARTAHARLRLSVLRGKNPPSTSLFHCTDLRGRPSRNSDRAAPL